MGYHIFILDNIVRVLEKTSPDELVRFERDLRENIAVSWKRKSSHISLMLSFFLAHYLLFNGEVDVASFLAFKLDNSELLRLVLLWLGSLFYAGMATAEYMWRLHRETYDYLYILQATELARTGLHDLRLPPNQSLALDLLRDDGSRLSWFVATAMRLMLSAFIASLPVCYWIYATLMEMKSGVESPDILVWFFSATSAFCFACSHYLLAMSAKMVFPKRTDRHPRYSQ